MVIKVNLNKIALTLLILCTLPISVPIVLLNKIMKADRDRRHEDGTFYTLLLIIWALVFLIFTHLSLSVRHSIQSIGNPITIQDGVATKVEVRCFTTINLPWSQDEVVTYLRWVKGSDIFWIDMKTNTYTNLESELQDYIKEMLKNTIIQSYPK